MSGTITIDDLIALSFSRREAGRNRKKQEPKPETREPRPVGKKEKKTIPPARTTPLQKGRDNSKKEIKPPLEKTKIVEEGSDLSVEDPPTVEEEIPNPSAERTKKSPRVDEGGPDLAIEEDLKIDPEEEKPGKPSGKNYKHQVIDEKQDELVVADDPISVDESEGEPGKTQRNKKTPGSVNEGDEDSIKLEKKEEDSLSGEDKEGEKTVRYFLDKFKKEVFLDTKNGDVTDLSGHAKHEHFGYDQAKKLIESVEEAASPYYNSKSLEDISLCSRYMYEALRSFGTSLKYLISINSYLRKNTGHDYSLKQNFQDVIRSFVYFDMAQVLRWISGNISKSSSMKPAIESLFKRFAALTDSVNMFLKNPAIAELKLDPDGKIKPISVKSKNIRNSEVLKLKKNVWRRKSKIEKLVPGSAREIKKYEEYLNGFEGAIKEFVKKEMENGGENSEETIKILKDMLNSLSRGGPLHYISRETKLAAAIRAAKKTLDDSVSEFNENRKKHIAEVKRILEEKKLEDPAEARRELAKQRIENKNEIEAMEKARLFQKQRG